MPPVSLEAGQAVFEELSLQHLFSRLFLVRVGAHASGSVQRVSFIWYILPHILATHLDRIEAEVLSTGVVCKLSCMHALVEVYVLCRCF